MQRDHYDVLHRIDCFSLFGLWSLSPVTRLESSSALHKTLMARWNYTLALLTNGSLYGTTSVDSRKIIIMFLKRFGRAHFVFFFTSPLRVITAAK